MDLAGDGVLTHFGDIMAFDNALASVAVRELQAAAPWYERLFGRPADRTPMPTVAEWAFPRGGVLQVYELPERAGSTSCTLAVTGLEEEIAKLGALGVDASTRTHSKQVSTVMIQDPDGNHIALAQALQSSVSR
jgi:predicted enzyme related to lactoylglutathione lyase